MNLFYMILAGGVGKRMGSPELPKQFLKVGGEPILVRTLRTFAEFGSFQQGVICCPVDWIEYTKSLLGEYGLQNESISVIAGGKNRSLSVRNGCRYLIENFRTTAEDIVLTHDAVRPFCDVRILKDNIVVAEEFGAANTVMPIYDSVIRSSTGDTLGETMDRRELYRVQTPQTFRLNQLSDIMASLSPEELERYTDVASVYFDRGFDVRLVRGDDRNLKITTPFDMAVADAILKSQP